MRAWACEVPPAGQGINLPTLSGKGQVSSDVFLFRLTWLPSLHHSPQGTFQSQKLRHWLHFSHSTSSGMEINHHFLLSKQPKCLKSPSVGRSPQDTWRLLRPLSVSYASCRPDVASGFTDRFKAGLAVLWAHLVTGYSSGPFLILVAHVCSPYERQKGVALLCSPVREEQIQFPFFQ